MINIYNISLSLIFLFIAIVHFYWSAGGKWFKYNAIPTDENNIPLFNPGLFPCLTIGIFFVFFTIMVNSELFLMSVVFQRNSSLLILIIFILRIIGDFKFVGIFKKVRNTVFAKMDNRYYIPLCIIVCTLLAVSIKIRI